jgi:hypothetical protein
MSEPDDQKTTQNPKEPAAGEELRWLWIRVGVRLGIGLLVVVAALLLILGAG